MNNVDQPGFDPETVSQEAAPEINYSPGDEGGTLPPGGAPDEVIAGAVMERDSISPLRHPLEYRKASKRVRHLYSDW